MRKTGKGWMGLLVALLLVLSMAACGKHGGPAGEEKASDGGQNRVVKVAVAFPGSIKDLGWNQDLYEALMRAGAKYGLGVSFQESVAQSELKDVLRNYAADGYDLVIAADLYFTDTTVEVAQEFPQTMFAIVHGTKAGGNVAAVTTSNWESTYLAGALAGLITKTNKIGILTATDSPVALKMVKGFKNGARETNPNVEVLHSFVGNWNDVVKGKELVRSMVKQGADVIYTQSGQVNVGAVEAAKEAGVYAIGSMVDMWEIAPDTVVASAIAPPGALLEKLIDMYMEGTLEGKRYVFGIKDGVEDLSPYHNFEDKLSQEVKDKVAVVRQKLIEGKVPEPSL
ncbi:MAG: BMP family protein [Thermoanaerobacteraceae bacterium]|nr:BMP family protein [Thermoanaerobacteraceae bacterium]